MLFASTAESLASVGTALMVAAGGKIVVGAQNDHKTGRLICLLSDAKPVAPTTRQTDGSRFLVDPAERPSTWLGRAPRQEIWRAEDLTRGVVRARRSVVGLGSSERRIGTRRTTQRASRAGADQSRAQACRTVSAQPWEVSPNGCCDHGHHLHSCFESVASSDAD